MECTFCFKKAGRKHYVKRYSNVTPAEQPTRVRGIRERVKAKKNENEQVVTWTWPVCEAHVNGV